MSQLKGLKGPKASDPAAPRRMELPHSGLRGRVGAGDSDLHQVVLGGGGRAVGSRGRPVAPSPRQRVLGQAGGPATGPGQSDGRRAVRADPRRGGGGGGGDESFAGGGLGPFRLQYRGGGGSVTASTAVS